jgi:hypothetical protein
MSFPNPDNYARDCDCGTAGANTTPPPATIQGEIDLLDTRVTVLEETNDVIISSGGIADLTTAQQALIREGSIVVTTDGKRWVYSGAGSKVLEASYIELSDLTIGSTANLPLITGTSGVITAGSFGTTTNTFCQGDDPRLSDARTPLSHTHGNISNGGLIGTTANLPIITGTGGLLQAGSFGTATNTFCQGNDVRVNHVRPLGTDNIFVSNTALSSASLSGAANTAVGVSALVSNTTGSNNTANGANALTTNSTGSNNTANGQGALYLNNGTGNVAVGVNALYNNTTGANNCGIGRNSLLANTDGNSNTALGFQAGDTIQTGGNNICIGAGADVSTGSRANCIVLGANATAQVDGEIAFSSTLATKTTIGANGGATALTALPVGYIRIRIGATAFQIPYYNV